MRLEFGFGTGTQSVEVCDDRLAGILHANEPPPGLTGEDAVRAALDAPIGAPPIEQVVRPNEKIAIVTSDITRPCPTWKILPPLLDRLYAADIKREDITLIFALGTPWYDGCRDICGYFPSRSRSRPRDLPCQH